MAAKLTNAQIAWRAAQDLPDGSYVNLGIGFPEMIAKFKPKGREVVYHTENGILDFGDVPPCRSATSELWDLITAGTTVSVPEMFRYWLQGGRVSIGFLGAAQLDKFGNINTTVIGDYAHPKTRLPGGGGAPEIATSSGEIYITMAQSKRVWWRTIDFVTSFGHGERRLTTVQRLGIDPRGLRCVTTVYTSRTRWSKDIVDVSLLPGVTRDKVQETCGWPVQFAGEVAETPPPTALELKTLRDLQARTKAAHEGVGKEKAA